MAQALDLGAVAEGVETADQARMLHALGYRHAQGYLFAPPLFPDDLAALLTDQPAAHGLVSRP